MIYVVFNQSYEGDGYDSPSNIIMYMSTNKEDAYAFFKKYCTNLPTSDKWNYCYQLYAYPDGYNNMTMSERYLIREESATNE